MLRLTESMDRREQLLMVAPSKRPRSVVLAVAYSILSRALALSGTNVTKCHVLPLSRNSTMHASLGATSDISALKSVSFDALPATLSLSTRLLSVPHKAHA